MSCRNPNTEISAEISETLETLGSKIENAQNFILTVYGGVLGRLYCPMHKIAPKSKY
jgi:hypothetical protein